MGKAWKSKLLSVIIAAIILSSTAVTNAEVYTVTSFAEFQSALTASQTNSESDIINITVPTITVPSTLMYYPPLTETSSLTINGMANGGTVLDGGGGSHIILEISYSTAPPSDGNVVYTIKDITFQNVANTGYTALYVYPYQAEIRVYDCKFLNNNVEYGAAYLSSQGNIMVSGCEFTSNVSYENAGGLYLDTDALATVNNSSFTSNQITYSGDGAGAQVSGDRALVTGNTFSGNTLEEYYYYGGGALYVDTSTTTEISDNIFENNTITYAGYGGAAYVYTYGGTLVIKGNEIINNYNNDYYGGGLYVDAENAEIADNLFKNNSSDYYGGGIYLEIDDTAQLYNNLIVDNEVRSATSGQGGGIFLYGSASDPLTYILTNNSISENTAHSGGGIYFSSFGDSHSLALRNNIVWGNSASGSGDDLYIDADREDNGVGATINFSNNNYGDPLTGGLYITGCNGSCTYIDNIYSDPLFANTAAGDYHLSPVSPCRDRGNNSFVTSIPIDYDFEGDDRIFNSSVDIGADEFFLRILTGDVNGDGNVDLVDAILVLKLLAGDIDLGMIYKEADIDNGILDMADALSIIERVLNPI